MSQRASWDLKEVCGQSIPQNGEGGKGACGVKVRSPMEGQAHRRSGAACILGIGEIRGAGVFGKGKRVSPGRGEIRGGSRTGKPARRRAGRRNAPTPV